VSRRAYGVGQFVICECFREVVVESGNRSGQTVGFRGGDDDRGATVQEDSAAEDKGGSRKKKIGGRDSARYPQEKEIEEIRGQGE
jgi:hypothetical protein